jgi:hypothetical protein
MQLALLSPHSGVSCAYAGAQLFQLQLFGKTSAQGWRRQAGSTSALPSPARRLPSACHPSAICITRWQGSQQSCPHSSAAPFLMGHLLTVLTVLEMLAGE